MTTATVNFRSPALGKRATYNIILPDEGEGPFPVLVQLHGLTDDCNAWIERSNLVRYAESYPLVIVLPDGGTSAYLNWKHADRLGRQNYEDLVVADIADHVKRHFTVTDGPWAIGGLSMGGWGAMWLGLKYSDRFASIWSHSSKFDWKASQLGLSMLANQLIDENRAFHAHLERIGLPHTYKEHAGAHTWDYWDLHVQEALAQHAEVLGITAVTD
jgi:S-formylglutathione hydrolase FrmB